MNEHRTVEDILRKLRETQAAEPEAVSEGPSPAAKEEVERAGWFRSEMAPSTLPVADEVIGMAKPLR
jgi:hypothetical protein